MTNNEGAKRRKGATPAASHLSRRFILITAALAISALFVACPANAVLGDIQSLHHATGNSGAPGGGSTTAPSISLSKASLSFAAQVGGGNPSMQTISVTNSGAGTLSGLTETVSYTTGSGWLTVSFDKSTAPATLTAQSTTGTLSAGTYKATVTVASNVSGVQSQTIPVSFVVSASGTTQYTLTVSNDGYGTTNPAGSESVNSGASTNISATPSSGYHFDHWAIINGTPQITNADSASTTVLLSGNAAIEAVFAPTTYTLSFQNDGHGSSTPSTPQTVDSGAATSISATPTTGYTFSHWGVISGSPSITNVNSASTTVTLSSGNATIEAYFTIVQSQLTVDVSGVGSTSPSGTVTVNYGASTSITATPTNNYTFITWEVTSGSATIRNLSALSTSVTLTEGNATIRADFRPPAPNSVAASKGTYTNYVLVSWQTVAGSSVTYDVYRSTSSSGPFTNIVGSTTSSGGAGAIATFDDTTAAAGTDYYYEVSCSDVSYMSPNSSPAVLGYR